MELELSEPLVRVLIVRHCGASMASHPGDEDSLSLTRG